MMAAARPPGYLDELTLSDGVPQRATHNQVITMALPGMISFLAISYVLILLLFLIVGYTTTPRRRLHLGLFIVASIFWPIALLAVIGVVAAEKLGVPSKPLRSGEQIPPAREPSAARASASVFGR